jgi:hypothetical protein
MEEGVRRWTAEEQRDLFQGYFDGASMPCPSCAQEVGFRMNHTREVVTLLMRCTGCDNVALLFFGGVIGLPAREVRHQPNRW